MSPAAHHSHDHAHRHDHPHGHDHGHRHDHAGPVPARPSFSLLTLSVWQRLAGALALCAGLWLAVLWALK